ncbi:zinc ribbon domain-containing protein [Oscillochloris sp. ZM17-4]|uniref:zinc ribbon domain-containing protein n=1 Tax=Oscillochloris sp. ZM17-4 TaxID=2866714 RepID=UPI001C73CD58|nr:zinc ribbon domain-containing protein [Oscillochloris sp. ZM17-4]MBX0330743.1 zinc ribbon domain-containing protein [Oscillochloris sp. ZM17-4]
MVERICPACQHGNPLDNRYCGACGGPLQQDALARAEQPLSIMIAGQRLPVAQVKQVGTALAVGLATVAAEAGVAWLRRRAEAARLPAVIPAPQQAAAIIRPDADLVRNTVTIVSQRVVEVWEHGSLARQVVEKHVWRKEQ